MPLTMKQLGVILVIQSMHLHEDTKPSDDSFSPKSIEELQKLLTKAVADEDYETAAKLRDEISKR